MAKSTPARWSSRASAARHLLVALVVASRRSRPSTGTRRRACSASVRHAQPLRPVGARRAREAPRVAAGSRGCRTALQLGRERGSPPAPGGGACRRSWHVLDEDRAGVHAGAAGRAVPEHLVVDDVADHLLVRRVRRRGAVVTVARGREQATGLLVEQVILEVQNQILGGQLLAANARGTFRLTPPALSATVGIEQILPGELLDLRDADGLVPLQPLLDIGGRQRATRPGSAELDVRPGGDDVQVLRVRDVDQEAEHQQDVAPPAYPVQRLLRRPGARRPSPRQSPR